MFKYRKDILARSPQEVIDIMRTRPRYPTIDYPEITRQRPLGPHYKPQHSHDQYERMKKAEKQCSSKNYCVAYIPMSNPSSGKKAELTWMDITRYLQESNKYLVRSKSIPGVPPQRTFASKYIQTMNTFLHKEKVNIYISGTKCPLSPREGQSSPSPSSLRIESPTNGSSSPTEESGRSIWSPTNKQPIRITVKPKKRKTIRRTCLSPIEELPELSPRWGQSNCSTPVIVIPTQEPDCDDASLPSDTLITTPESQKASSPRGQSSSTAPKNELPYSRGRTVREGRIYRCAACTAPPVPLFVAASSTPLPIVGFNRRQVFKTSSINDDPCVLQVKKIALLSPSKKYLLPRRRQRSLYNMKCKDAFPGIKGGSATFQLSNCAKH